MKPESIIIGINVPAYWDEAKTHREVTAVFDTNPDTAIELRRVDTQPDGDLFMWCPLCNGEGTIHRMQSNPNVDEVSYPCERCVDMHGLVKVERGNE